MGVQLDGELFVAELRVAVEDIGVRNEMDAAHGHREEIHKIRDLQDMHRTPEPATQILPQILCYEMPVDDIDGLLDIGMLQHSDPVRKILLVRVHLRERLPEDAIKL